MQSAPMPGLRYAGFWIRLVAFVVDTIVIYLVMLSAVAVLFFVSPGISTAPSLAIYVLLFSLGPVVLVPYSAGFWGLRSRTPGMAALNMRIVRADTGEKIGLGRAIVRAIGLLISLAPYGLGFLWVAFDGRKQGWHDKLAGTVVVRPT